MIYFPNAKINLGLRITGRRADGYHDLQSTFLPVGWCDVLEVHVNPEGVRGELNFSISGLEVEGDLDSNLVVKAHALLNSDFDLPEISAMLLKNIPSGAGLGGGSSDGSIMLKAINEQCGLGLDTISLKNYAKKLGSDCPFFISNEPSSVSGRGEIVETFKVGDNLKELDILIVHPGIGVSTVEAFGMIEIDDQSLEFDYGNLDTISNEFQHPISEKFPEVTEAVEFIESKGALFTQMTGSGSAVFGLFKKGESEGLKMKSKAEERGWSAYFGAFL